MKKILLTFAVLAFSGNLLAGTFCSVAQNEAEDSMQFNKGVFQGFVDDAKGLTLIVKPSGEAVEIEKLFVGVATQEQIQQILKDIDGAPLLVVKRQEDLSHALGIGKYTPAKTYVVAMAIGQLTNTGLTLVGQKYAINCVDKVNPGEVTNKPEPVK